MIEHRHLIFVLAVVKVAKRDVTAVRSLGGSLIERENTLFTVIEVGALICVPYWTKYSIILNLILLFLKNISFNT